MKKLKYYTLVFLMSAALAGVITLAFWCDVKLWRAEHPNSPIWVYWVRGGR